MMETGMFSKHLAREIRAACMSHIRDNKISYGELAGMLGLPHRGAVTVMQSREWSLERAVTVAEALDIDVSIRLEEPSVWGHAWPSGRKVDGEGNDRSTMNRGSRSTLRFISKQGL
jgi:hypothetical protein